MSEKSISSSGIKHIQEPTSSASRVVISDPGVVISDPGPERHAFPEEHAPVKGKAVESQVPGVYGFGDTGYGVLGRSKYSAGICGEGDKDNGNHAGQFNGNVEITGDLDVKGSITPRNLKGNVQLDGNFNVTGVINVTDNIFLSGGADFAEDFDIANAECIEPGTVMVLGEEGVLHQSSEAYDKHVAGVISGAGEYKPGIVLDKQHSQADRKPIALFGKVYCKVDAAYGAIEVGDLLTSSPTPGHAMKANDTSKAFGSVIGKSLRPWKDGHGLIPILIALQ